MDATLPPMLLPDLIARGATTTTTNAPEATGYISVDLVHSPRYTICATASPPPHCQRKVYKRRSYMEKTGHDGGARASLASTFGAGLALAANPPRLARYIARQQRQHQYVRRTAE